MYNIKYFFTQNVENTVLILLYCYNLVVFIKYIVVYIREKIIMKDRWLKY